jgi:hypothetical protein
MSNEQEERLIRILSLQTAALLLGRMPKPNEVNGELDPHMDSADLSSSKAYADYLWLAKRIEQYARSGGSLP